MTKKGLDPKIMQNIALVVLVKKMNESPERMFRLTKEDFLAVDNMDDADKWTLEVDADGDVVVGLLAKGGLN